MKTVNTPIVPVLLTADETAQLVAVSTRTLWRLLSAGKFPRPVRVGGSTRWRRAEVEKWVCEGCPDPVTSPGD